MARWRRIVAGRRGQVDRAPVEVRILRPVLDRIHRCLTQSEVEEGGKLIGRVHEDGRSRVVDVESYLDSGPNVSNSATHLHPDGRHQERLFRLVESYDQTIEHVGSWHSHHCNGLRELSAGDIRGYHESVNDRNYNLDLFVSVLVVDVDRQGPLFKTFVFERDVPGFTEIPMNALVVIDKQSRFEDLLRVAERISLTARHGVRGEPLQSVPAEPDVNLDPMAPFRAEDAAWFREMFPRAQIVRDRRTQALAWKWTVDCGEIQAVATYQYPEDPSGRILARLSIGSGIVSETQLRLNKRRHKALGRFLDLAATRIEGADRHRRDQPDD